MHKKKQIKFIQKKYLIYNNYRLNLMFQDGSQVYLGVPSKLLSNKSDSLDCNSALISKLGGEPVIRFT